jgi:hypothetical protein
MSRTSDIAVDPPSLMTTRMPRRNAIVKRKRGRTNKSDDRHQDFDDSSNHLSLACINPSTFPEAIDEEQRRNKAIVHHHHKDLMPLKDLAMFMSTQLTYAQTKGLFDSNGSTRRLPVPSEKGRNTSVASEA